MLPDPDLPKRNIVLGASTGGVEALYTVLARFPADCPPVFIVQHMRPTFLESFVAGLDRACQARVRLAEDRATAKPGEIYVAPPGEAHLTLADHGALTMRLSPGPPMQGHRPSVDRLFQSCATLPVCPAAALLTGMGRDGAQGLLEIRQAGGPTICQDEQTSVVFGMPRAAAAMGAATHILPLGSIAAALLRAAGYAPTQTSSLIQRRTQA